MDQFARQISMGSGVVDLRTPTGHDRHVFSDALASAWPMDEAPSFEELLKAIDESAMRLSQRRH